MHMAMQYMQRMHNDNSLRNYTVTLVQMVTMHTTHKLSYDILNQ